KAAHITFVIFWMAGLFLLPRLYVYHQETAVGSPEDRAWIEREARVRSIILMPAIIAVWVLGLMLAFDIDAFHQGWFVAKFLLVIGLSGYHGWLRASCKKTSRGARTPSGQATRAANGHCRARQCGCSTKFRESWQRWSSFW